MLNDNAAERWIVDDIQVKGTAAAPSTATITSLTPNTGPVGTSVIIAGTNFTGATAVSFNGTAATSFAVNSATEIQAFVPASATTGNVTVTVPSGTSNGVTFTVTTGTATTAVVSPTSLSGFSTRLGTASAAQSYVLRGSNQPSAVTVAAPAGYAVSLDNSAFSSSVSASASAVNASAGQTIYVRLTGATAGSFMGNVSNTDANSNVYNVAVSGTVVAPTLTASPTALSGFTYAEGIGPSGIQNYTLTYSDFTGYNGTITVAAPASYELSTSSTFATSLGSSTTVSYTGTGANQTTTLYVRLKAGLTVASSPYNGTINNTNGSLSAPVTVSGSVTPVPVLMVSPASLSGFATPVGMASVGQSYVLTGTNVTANVTVTAPTGYAVSLDNTAYSSSITTITAATVNGSGVTIYVRLTGATAGTPSGNVTNATTNAATVNVAVSGNVTNLTVGALSSGTFSTSVGTPSTARSYTLTGASLTNDVTVTPPAGYAVSQTSATTGFGGDGAPITVVQSSGSVSATIYVRLTGATAGSPAGNVTNASPNATTRNVAVSGSVLVTATEPTTQPTITVSNVGFTQADITIGGGNGQKRLVVIRTSGATSVAPADNTTYTPSLAYSSGTSTGGTTNYVLVADAGTTTATITGLSSVQGYVVAVYAYNDNNTAGQENYLTATPGTASFSTVAVPTVYYAKATGDLSQLATYGFNTDGSGQSPPNFTTTGKTYTVSGTGRTIGASWTVSGSGSKVVLADGASFTIPAAFTLTGTIDLQGTAYLTVLNTTGPTLGSLATTSTVEYAQASGSYVVPAPSGGYGNLKLTNATKTFATGTTTINGSLTVQDVANVAGFAGSSAATYTTLVVSGNVTLLGTTTFNPAAAVRFSLNLTASGTQTISGNGNTLRLFRLRTLNNGGNIILSDANGGTPVEAGTTSGGGVELYSNTTLALNANTLYLTAGGQGRLNFDTNSYGTITLSPTSSLNLENTNGNIGYLVLTPGAITLQDLRIVSASGDALVLYSTDLVVNGTLTLPTATSSLDITSHALTLNGTVAGSGSISGSTTSDLTIGGTGALGTLSFLSGYQQLRNLTLNRASTGTVTLGSPLSVSGALALTNGLLTTSAANLLTLAQAATVSGGSAGSFISGPVARPVAPVSSAATVFFPVGKGTAYRPLKLNIATQTSTTTYRAEQLEGNPGQNGTNPAANDGTTLTRVDRVRAFTLTPYSGTTVTQPTGFAGTVTLRFGPDDQVSDSTAASLVVAKRANSSSAWTNIGRNTAGTTGTPATTPYQTGTLTSGSISSFSDFALASTDPSLAANPLPVQLTAFAAARASKGVQLTWATATELNSATFEVERSLDGKTFERVASVRAQGSTTQAHEYAALDAAAPAAQLYYRLKQVDVDGKTAYSPTVTVAAGEGAVAEIALSPNPARESISLVTSQPTAYTVHNALGQVVRAGTTAAGSTTVPVAELPSGVYFFELHTSAGRVVRKFVKE